MPDREKVINDLLEIRKDYEDMRCKVSVQIINDALALLKEHDNCENCAIAIEDRQFVVRCKDCIWFHKPDAETKKSCKCNYHGCVTEENKYCWWGEKDE